jgi:hypothetical protein
MNRFGLVGVAAFTMFSGFAYAEPPTTTSKSPIHPSDSLAECPMGVPGAQVSTAHTTNGEALTFSTTTPAQVTELRRRVHAATEMHNKNHATGGPHGDMMGDGMMGGMTGSNHMMGTATGSNHMTAGTMMPQSHATGADVNNGACITLTPTPATDLEKLQSAIGIRAERMQHHGCGPVAQNEQP